MDYANEDPSIQQSNEQESFIRDLIIQYKNKPMLWDKKHPKYRSKSERLEAYGVILEECKKYHPEADVDFIRSKIDSMRSTFRREYRKVKASKAIAQSPNEVYKPSLWYYNSLMFTLSIQGDAAEEEDEGHDEEDVVPFPEKRIPAPTAPFWSRDSIIILISLYKKYPCLWAYNNPQYKVRARRMEALKKIAHSLADVTGRDFQPHHVRRKITLLRSQFVHECRKTMRAKQKGRTYSSSWWCFGPLGFLKSQCYKSSFYRNGPKTHVQTKRSRSSSPSSGEDHADHSETIKIEAAIPASSDFGGKVTQNDDTDNDDDLFDTIAKNVAHKLRDMTESQRNIAERIVKDVMYHGLMENLTAQSKLVLDGA